MTAEWHEPWGAIRERLLTTTLMCYRWDVRSRAFLGILGLAALITAVAAGLYFRRIDRFWGITQTDFSVFWYAGYQSRHHGSMYAYQPTRYTTDPEYRFKYAPPLGMAMRPLACLPIQHAIQWWYALTGLALLGALAGVRALVRPDPIRDLSFPAYGFILLTILRPYLANLRLGQVDVLLACGLIGFLVALSRGRDLLAGLWLGIAILCKLVPAIWLVYLAALRRWRAMFWTLAAIALILTSPLPVLGPTRTAQAMAEWLTVLRTSSYNWEWLVRYKNQSVVSVVLRGLTGGNASAVTPGLLALALGIAAAALIAYGWMVWRAMRLSRSTENRLAALVPPALVMIGMVIFSPHAWKATYIHLLLPYTVLIAHLTTRDPSDRWGWVLLGGSFLLVSGTAPNLVLGSTRSQAIHLFAPMTWGALLLAAGLWRIPDKTRAGR